MVMKELQRLILKYALEGIPYADFRREFASSLVNPRSLDEEQFAYKVESLCADHSEGFIDEGALRARLVKLCPIFAEVMVSPESAFQLGAGNERIAISLRGDSDSENDPDIDKAEYAVA